MDDENKLDLQKLYYILDQHKGLAAAVFFVVFSLAMYLAVTLPDIYRSTALILFVPQELPDSYVQSTVPMTMQERIDAVTRDILSRTRLEGIIQEFDLYANQPTLSIGDRVRRMRKNIDVDAEEGENTFELSFESRSPLKAQQVAHRLASVFVDESLKLREERATATTAFFQVEADRLKRELTTDYRRRAKGIAQRA